jgi:hypothetical protein
LQAIFVDHFLEITPARCRQSRRQAYNQYWSIGGGHFVPKAGASGDGKLSFKSSPNNRRRSWQLVAAKFCRLSFLGMAVSDNGICMAVPHAMLFL